MSIEQGREIRICPDKENTECQIAIGELMKSGAMNAMSVIGLESVARGLVAENPEKIACPADCPGATSEPRRIPLLGIRLPSAFDRPVCPLASGARNS